MENLKKYLGVILLLLGVICLVVYKYALQANGLLVTGIVFELAGILAYIFICFIVLLLLLLSRFSRVRLCATP